MKHMVKVGPGHYIYRGRHIVRTQWEGPRDGKKYGWELGDEDQYGAVNLDSKGWFRTLREAKTALEAAQ